MHHGDGLASLVGGALLSVTANLAGWVANTHAFTHGLEMLLYGVIGGLGGWGARKLIERFTNKNTNKNEG